MIPGLIETYLEVKESPMPIVLEHQIGKIVSNYYLQIYIANSSWHIFARMAIRRLRD